MDGKGNGFLEVRDNGVGFPEDFDLGRMGGIGLDIVQGLVAQLGGELDLSHNGGVIARINFLVEN
ncbi:MAG: sensor histidine kinase, partial [Gammaproteobacteria bacterium]|nr:sensor histidine kinase [Gammaproteobacteria bacterium]